MELLINLMLLQILLLHKHLHSFLGLLNFLPNIASVVLLPAKGIHYDCDVQASNLLHSYVEDYLDIGPS